MEENKRKHANRVKARLDNASVNMNISKELEGREMALLERVKMTYQVEKKMVERLHQVNAESPV